jgi:uncharacterized OB-fold protein
MAERMVAPGLVSGSGEAARLLAGRRRADGKLAFPLPQTGDAEDYEPVELPRDGVLWSWTVQRFCPKTPYNGFQPGEGFRPYAVGYVEFPGQIIVEGRLVTEKPEALRIGAPMRLALEVYGRDPDGTEIVTYAFTPVE